jgi:hypothetical protein
MLNITGFVRESRILGVQSCYLTENFIISQKAVTERRLQTEDAQEQDALESGGL